MPRLLAAMARLSPRLAAANADLAYSNEDDCAAYDTSAGLDACTRCTLCTFEILVGKDLANDSMSVLSAAGVQRHIWSKDAAPALLARELHFCNARYGEHVLAAGRRSLRAIFIPLYNESKKHWSVLCLALDGDGWQFLHFDFHGSLNAAYSEQCAQKLRKIALCKRFELPAELLGPLRQVRCAAVPRWATGYSVAHFLRRVAADKQLTLASICREADAVCGDDCLAAFVAQRAREAHSQLYLDAVRQSCAAPLQTFRQRCALHASARASNKTSEQ